VSIDRAVRQNLAVPEAAVIFEGGESYVLVIQRAPPGQGGLNGRPNGAQGGRPGQDQARGQARGEGGPAGAQAGGQPQGPRMIAVRKVITTGLRQDGWVEVLGGLTAEDRVVADGTNRVRPNDPVRVTNGPGGRPGAGGGPAGGPPAAMPAPRDAPAGGRPSSVPGQRPGPDGGQPGGGDPLTTFRSADSDRDGAVTLAEWGAAGRPEAMFGRLDSDHDGRLTTTEMQAFVSARAAGRPNS